MIVNQVAYIVVMRLASGGTAGGGDGTGITIYATAFLIVMVPHSMITVSLTTAILPRLSAQAAESDLEGLARSLASTLRTRARRRRPVRGPAADRRARRRPT